MTRLTLLPTEPLHFSVGTRHIPRVLASMRLLVYARFAFRFGLDHPSARTYGLLEPTRYGDTSAASFAVFLSVGMPRGAYCAETTVAGRRDFVRSRTRASLALPLATYATLATAALALLRYVPRAAACLPSSAWAYTLGVPAAIGLVALAFAATKRLVHAAVVAFFKW